MRATTAVTLLALLAPLACGRADDAPASREARAPGESATSPGEHHLAVDGGTIWYQVTGTGNATPAILLHGGPGYSSFYLKPLDALGDERPVVRYDQLGAGKSDQISDTTMFTIAHFVDELEALRQHLGYEKVHLVGHSWGTILAVEYDRVHPEHVESMTLGSAALDIPAWGRNAQKLLLTLSDSAQRAIRTNEAAGTYDTPDYQAANEEFMGRYVTRDPMVADMDSLMATVNPAIYMYMQGPSEFTIVGTLKDYDATPLLPRITVPVLYTVGEFDEADTATIRRFTDMTPGARMEVLPGAAHITMWDAPEANIRVVREFLRSVDAKAGSAGG